MNVNSFAEKVKKKYPEYKDIDNALLTEKILKKYPEYRNVVDISKSVQPSFIGEQLQREEQFVGDIFKAPSMLGQIPVPIQKAVTPLIPGTQFLPEISGMGPLELAEKAYMTKLGYMYRRPGGVVRAGIEELQTKPILDKTVFKRLFTAAKEGLTTERKISGSQIAENMGIRNSIAKAVMGVWYDITTEPLIMGAVVTGAARGRIVKSIEKEAIKRAIKLNPDVDPVTITKNVKDFMKTPGFKTSVGALKFKELRQKAKAFTQKAKPIKPEAVIKEVKPTPPVTPKPVTPEKSVIVAEAEILKATGKSNTTVMKYVKDTVVNGENLRKITEKVIAGTIPKTKAVKQVAKDIDKLEKPKIVKPVIIGKGKVDLPKAVDKFDYRSILKAGIVKYPEVEMKNFSPEEKRKIQFLFSKGGQDIDSWQDEVQSMYPQLEIKDAYDLIRKAIDQTGKELKSSKELENTFDDDYNKYMEDTYGNEEAVFEEQGRTLKEIEKSLSKEDIEAEAVKIGAGGYPEIWDDESLIVKEQLSLFGEKPKEQLKLPEEIKEKPRKYFEKYSKIADQVAKEKGLSYRLSKEDIEDLSQDLKVKMLEIDWDKYVKGEDIGGYIRKALRYKAIDILKKKVKEERKTVPLEDFFPPVGAEKPGIKVQVKRWEGVDERTGETIEQIIRIITEPKVRDIVLKDLTERQLIDILMRNPVLTSKEQGYMRLVLKGYSQKEIADKMALTEGTVSKIATSAKDKAQEYQWWKLARGKRLLRDWQETLKVKQVVSTYGSVEKQKKAIRDLTSKVKKTRIEGKARTLSDIKSSLVKKGRVDYRGIKVKNAQHIAELFQVFRDPKTEHLHLIYLDENNKILAHNTLSSGAINYVSLSEKELFYKIEQRRKRLGARWVIPVHNHPSGSTIPSEDDKQITLILAKNLGSKVEHIVIDHDNYSKITALPLEGVWDEKEIKYTPKIPDWTVKEPALNSAQKIIDWFKGMRTSPDTITVGYLDLKLGMIAYEPYNKEILNRGTLPETIKQKMKTYGAGTYFISGETLSRSDFHAEIYPAGLQDIIIKVGEDSFASVRGRNQLPFIEKAKIKPGRYLREELKEYDISKALITTKRDKLVKFLKKYFTSTRGVAWQVNTLNKNRAMAIVADQFDSFTTAKKVQKWIGKTGIKSEELIEDVLIGNVPVDNVPIEIRPEVIKMREDIDKLSKLLSKHGVAPVTTRIVIQNNIGKYLTRKYKLFENKVFVPKSEDVQSMADYMQEQFKKKFPLLKLDKSELIGKIKQLASRHDISLNIRGRAITVPTNHYVKRKNLPMEVKKFYGEIHQPVWRYLKTISQLTTDVHTTLFFNTIKDYSSKVPTDTQFKKLPDDKKWGALRNRYVDESLYDFLHDTMSPAAVSGIGRMLETFLVTPFKWTKTVGSIPTHARNTLGNVMFSLLSRTAITNPLNWGYYTKALDIILRRTTAHREEWKNLIKRRVLEVQYIGGEIANFEVKKFMERLLKEEPASWPEKIYDFTVKKPIKFANILYNMEDQIYRIAFALKHPEDIKNTDRYYTNYKDMPIAVDVTRKFAGFGVFFSFKYNVARIVYANAKEGIKDAKKGNFGTLATLIFALSFPSLLRKASMIAGDIDEEEIKKLENIMPVYRKHASFIYYRNEWGELKAFDLTYIWPTGDYERAIKSLLKGDIQSFSDSLNLFAHPLFDAWNIIMEGTHPYMHYRIRESKDDTIKQVVDTATALIKSIYLPASMPIPSITALLKEEGKLRPGPLTGYQVKILLDSYNEISDKYGKVRYFPEELKNFLTGIRTFQMFPEIIITNRISQLSGDINRVKRNYNRWTTNNPDAPQWEKDKQEKLFEKRLNKIENELKDVEELKGSKYF